MSTQNNLCMCVCVCVCVCEREREREEYIITLNYIGSDA